MSLACLAIESERSKYLQNGTYKLYLRNTQLVITDGDQEWIVGEGAFDPCTSIYTYPNVDGDKVIEKDTTLMESLLNICSELVVLIEDGKMFLTKEMIMNDPEIQELLRGEPGKDGQDGQDGLSAFEIWVEKQPNGEIEYTIEDYLKTTLQTEYGPSVFDLWVEEQPERPIEYSMDDWLSITIDASGKNAYERYLDEYPESTLEEFLESTMDSDGKNAFQRWLADQPQYEKYTIEEYIATTVDENGESDWDRWLMDQNEGEYTYQDWLLSTQEVTVTNARERWLNDHSDKSEDDWWAATGEDSFNEWVSRQPKMYTYTEDDFLKALKGERGAQGPKGNRGARGPKGEKGDLGRPGDDASSNWIIGTVLGGLGVAGAIADAIGLYAIEAQVTALDGQMKVLLGSQATDLIDTIGDALDSFDEVTDAIDTTSTLGKITNWFKQTWSRIKANMSGYTAINEGGQQLQFANAVSESGFGFGDSLGPLVDVIYLEAPDEGGVSEEPPVEEENIDINLDDYTKGIKHVVNLFNSISPRIGQISFDNEFKATKVVGNLLTTGKINSIYDFTRSLIEYNQNAQAAIDAADGTTADGTTAEEEALPEVLSTYDQIEEKIISALPNGGLGFVDLLELLETDERILFIKIDLDAYIEMKIAGGKIFYKIDQGEWNSVGGDTSERLDALEESVTGLDTRVSTLENDTTLSDRIDTIELNTLRVSYIDTNAALKVTSADENNDPRYVLKFNINITFNDSNYMPIFTSEKKTIVVFSYSYIYSTSGKAYAHTCYVYAESSNGLTSNITIESCYIHKGSIDIVVSVKRTSDLHTFGITWGLAYYPDALISYPVSDEYIISKNISYDNDIRIRSTEAKNDEQDKRLDALESKDIAHEERIGSIEAVDTAQNETISNINTKNDEQDERLDDLEIKDTIHDNDISYINSKNADQDFRLDTIELNTLRVSNTNTNATLEVTNADENNDPRSTFRFKINLTFHDPNFTPTFTSETKQIVSFSFYEIPSSGDTTVQTGYVYADSSNGLTSNFGIESSSIQKGSIELILNQTRIFKKFTLGDIFEKEYNPDAILSIASSNQYIISKNLTVDNDIRISSTEAKNEEQDGRLDGLDESLGGLDTRVSALESDTTLSDRMNGFDESLGGLATRVSALENDTTDSDRLDALDTRVSALENGTTDSARLDALEEKNKFQNVSENGTVFEGVLISDNLKSDNETRLSEVEKYFDKVYPIGSVWVTVSNTTPPIGTWKIQNNGYAAYLLTNSSGTNITGPLVYMYIRTA